MTVFRCVPTLFFLFWSFGHAADRCALVLGNDTYEHISPLTSSANEASTISEALTNGGFAVTQLLNGDARTLTRTLTQFCEDHRNATSALFYYSGHAIQVDGKNYLLPVDARLEHKADLRLDAISLDDITEQLEEAAIRLKILILDSCRNHPISAAVAPDWMSDENHRDGLAEVLPEQLPPGTLVAFSASPHTAVDPPQSRQSEFTLALGEQLQIKEDKTILDILANLSDFIAHSPKPWIRFDGSNESLLAFNTFPFLTLGTPSPASPSPSASRADSTDISSLPKPVVSTPETATMEHPYLNSLRMKFVPVPGTKVLFSVFETRVGDYAAFAEGNPLVDQEWRKVATEEEQGADHPVVSVSREQAEEFCRWLSLKEGVTYRLPTDWEWSAAAGIGDREDPDATPQNNYIWGGAYTYDPALDKIWKEGTPQYRNWDSWLSKTGYKAKADKGSLARVYPWREYEPDDYRFDTPTRYGAFGAWDTSTSPVGCYVPNHLGLYDLCGNADELCQDTYNPSADSPLPVIRGGNCGSRALPLLTRSVEPTWRTGFRCVLELE